MTETCSTPAMPRSTCLSLQPHNPNQPFVQTQPQPATPHSCCSCCLGVFVAFLLLFMVAQTAAASRAEADCLYSHSYRDSRLQVAADWKKASAAALLAAAFAASAAASCAAAAAAALCGSTWGSSAFLKFSALILRPTTTKGMPALEAAFSP